MKKPEKKKVGIDWLTGTQIPYGHEIWNEAWELWEKYHNSELVFHERDIDNNYIHKSKLPSEAELHEIFHKESGEQIS